MEKKKETNVEIPEEDEKEVIRAFMLDERKQRNRMEKCRRSFFLTIMFASLFLCALLYIFIFYTAWRTRMKEGHVQFLMFLLPLTGSCCSNMALLDCKNN